MSSEIHCLLTRLPDEDQGMVFFILFSFFWVIYSLVIWKVSLNTS